MGKNRKERAAGQERFLLRLEERNRLSAEANAEFEKIDIRDVTEHMLNRCEDEAVNRTMLKPSVLRNILLGRIQPSIHQRKLIIGAAKDMGWQAPSA